MMWLLTGLSLVGVILNIKKKRSCFVVWGFTNAAWAMIDLYVGLYAQAALFAIYFLLAIWGFMVWK